MANTRRSEISPCPHVILTCSSIAIRVNSSSAICLASRRAHASDRRCCGARPEAARILVPVAGATRMDFDGLDSVGPGVAHRRKATPSARKTSDHWRAGDLRRKCQRRWKWQDPNRDRDRLEAA